MITPLIEFGLAEFGSFEFGYEQGTLLGNASFTVTGRGSGSFASLVVNNFDFSSDQASTASFDGQTIVLADSETIKGTSAGLFEGNALRYASMTGNSNTDAFFTPGYLLESGMYSENVGNFVAVSVDPETLDIRGQATVLFSTGYALVSEVHPKGSSTTHMDMYAEGNSGFNVFGLGAFKTVPQAQTNAVTNIKGQVAVDAIAQALSMGKFGIASGGAGDIRGQTIRLIKMTAIGTGATTVRTQYRFISGFNSMGLGTTSTVMDAINPANMISVGQSTVNIRPGSPVLVSMPSAWDVVIRPYENRGVVWK